MPPPLSRSCRLVFSFHHLWPACAAPSRVQVALHGGIDSPSCAECGTLRPSSSRQPAAAGVDRLTPLRDDDDTCVEAVVGVLGCRSVVFGHLGTRRWEKGV